MIMTENELLIAISNMMDEKLKPIKITLENDILPRLQNIETCYTDTYRRYANGIEKLEAMEQDIAIMKKVIQEHSEKLNQIA
ncbi:MAG TPA: hypothetical protein IAC37_11845 [Candidatus Ventrimonas merdavium]|nr:hypothetical protein [Candidatus Ventrimonas merdavium]